MDIHKAFRIGAQKIAANEKRYTTLHKAHGIEEAQWELLTSQEYWSVDEARQIRTILANVVEVSMTIAGMPAIPLPGQYVAAVISEIVAPPNRILACTKAPDTFDAASALVAEEQTEVKSMTTTQLISLVLLYSGGFPDEPQGHKLSRDVAETMIRANTSEKKVKA